MIELKPHQKRAVDAALTSYQQGRRHAFLAHGGGAGKLFTSATIAMLVAKKQKDKATIWVITTGSAAEQQADELRLLTSDPLNALNVVTVAGNHAERAGTILLAQHARPRFVVLNFELLPIHWEALTLAVKPQDIVILDESHLIQTMKSTRSVLCRALCRQAGYRVLNSATPIWNYPDGLYAQLQACDPVGEEVVELEIGSEKKPQKLFVTVPAASTFWGNWKNYAKTFLNIEDGLCKGSKNPELLHARLEEFGVDIIETDDVWDFQVKNSHTYTMPLTASGKQMYDLVLNGIDRWIEQHDSDYLSGGGSAKSELKRSLFRQINFAKRTPVLSPANMRRLILTNRAKQHAQMDSFADYVDMEKLDALTNQGELIGGNTKVEWLMQYLKNHWSNPRTPGGVVVYSAYTDTVDEIAEYLKRNPLPLSWVRIDGTQSKAKTREARMAIQQGLVKVAFTTDKGAMSLNLQRLNTLVVLTPTFNWGKIVQLFARVKRIGQDNPIQLVWTVADKTIESAWLMPLLEKKKRDTNAVIHGKRSRAFDAMLDIQSLAEVRSKLQ